MSNTDIHKRTLNHWWVENSLNAL